MNRPPIPGTPSSRPLPMVPLPVPAPPDRAPVTVPGSRPSAHQPPGRRRWPPSRPVLAALAAAAAVAGAVVAFAAGGTPARHPAPPGYPPPLRACLTASAVPCYGQDPLHRAYHLDALYAHGITGARTTIALVIPGVNPWLRADLAVYCRFLRLPPAQLTVLTWGHVSTGRLTQASAGWAQEGTADAELAHFTAPRARLVYVQIPLTRAAPAALTDPMTALAWLATRQQVDVASFSWGTYENQIPRQHAALLTGMRAGLVTATRAGVSVVAATGDGGPTASFGPGHLHRQRTVVWPASDPLVTAVGATVAYVSTAGRRLAPDTVDGVTAPPGGYATGAGTSALFPRPAYQNPVAAVVGDHRGVADVAMDGCAWVYLHIPRLAHGLNWYYTCGTSFSAPLFAGITADAAQIAGHPLGPLNPLLYQMHGPADGVLDVTHGNDSLPGVPGYSAGPGFDLPSGIGAVGNAARFATTLGRLAHRPHR